MLLCRKIRLQVSEQDAATSETPPAGYQEVAISRDGRGNYHASFVYPVQEADQQNGHVMAIDLGIKTLATGASEQGRFYHIGGFKGHQWCNRQLDKIRSKRDRCQKQSRRSRSTRECAGTMLTTRQDEACWSRTAGHTIREHPIQAFLYSFPGARVRYSTTSPQVTLATVPVIALA